MAHIDMMTAIDDAFDHVEMMTAIDDAMDHVDMMTALDEATDFINKHQASSGYSTPIIASAGALFAIGAGFVIKNKFSAVENKDVEETLLWDKRIWRKIHIIEINLKITLKANMFSLFSWYLFCIKARIFMK